MTRTAAWKGIVLSPAFWGGVLCCVLTGVLVHQIRVGTGGLFVYPLDDSYIHLALAKTLAQHGVWGISPAEFGSASSSPGWTLILTAADVVFGPRLMMPIVLNLILVFAVLYVADYALRTFVPGCSLGVRSVVIFFLVIATPLPSLALLAMEHVAQTLSVMLVAVFAAEILAMPAGARAGGRATSLLLLGAALAGAIRYEAVFVVLPVFALLIWRRQLRLALLVAGSAAIGPIAFGLYSHHVSGYWLPFSVLAKVGMQEHLHAPMLRTLLIGRHGSVPALLPLLAFLCLRVWRRRFWDPVALLLLITTGVVAAHLVLAPLNWLMRYESYFVCLTILAIGAAIAGFLPDRTALARWSRMPRRNQVAFVLVVLALVVLARSIYLVRYLRGRIHAGFHEPVEAGLDRFHEHVQMANFIHDFYNHGTVVVNDIGAVAYYSDAYLLDMAGLGSAEPLRYTRRGQSFGKEQMAEWASARHASIAVLQPEWKVVQARTPADWTLIQEWRIPRNVVFPDHIVGVYAIRPEEIPELCAKLGKVKMLPGNMVVLDRCGAVAGTTGK